MGTASRWCRWRLGEHLLKNVSPRREWDALRARTPSLNQIAVLARTNADIAQAVALGTGTTIPRASPKLAVGDVLPDVVLRDAATGKIWTPKEIRGKRALSLFIAGSGGALAARAAAAKAARSGPLLVAVISEEAQGQATKSVLSLRDPQQTLIARFGSGVTQVLVDRAGFVRGIEPVGSNGKPAVKPGDPTPALAVGKPAPPFAITDTEGGSVKLAQFRGHKNVLVTFFPKCFTDG